MRKIDKNEMKERIDLGMKLGAIQALTEHKKAGRSIAIWRDERVVIVPAEEIEIPELPEVSENLKKYIDIKAEK